MIGALPGLHHDKVRRQRCLLHLRGQWSPLWERQPEKQGHFAEGDLIGVLLDLDAGWMRVDRNGKLCWPGFTEGATGPLVCAAQFGGFVGSKITVLPGAMAPQGAGDADKPWEAWEAPAPEPESESGSESDSE
jgi:hypothetical protein